MWHGVHRFELTFPHGIPSAADLLWRNNFKVLIIDYRNSKKQIHYGQFIEITVSKLNSKKAKFGHRLYNHISAKWMRYAIGVSVIFNCSARKLVKVNAHSNLFLNYGVEMCGDKLVASQWPFDLDEFFRWKCKSMCPIHTEDCFNGVKWINGFFGWINSTNRLMQTPYSYNKQRLQSSMKNRLSTSSANFQLWHQ